MKRVEGEDRTSEGMETNGWADIGKLDILSEDISELVQALQARLSRDLAISELIKTFIESQAAMPLLGNLLFTRN